MVVNIEAMFLFYKKLLMLTVIVILASVFLLFPVALPVLAAEKQENIDIQIKKQEQEYKRIQNQISSTKKKLSETNRKEKNVTQQIESLSQKITITEQKVNIVSLKIKKIQTNIIKLSEEIVIKNEKINYAQEMLSNRIVAMYKYGGITEFNLLLSSQGAEDALANSYLLGKIAEQDMALIKDLTLQKKELNETHQELKKQKVSLESHGKELKKEKTELKGAANERNVILSMVRKDKKLYMQQQKELLRASQELQSTVKRLLSEKRKLASRKNPGKLEKVYYQGGTLAWPLQGTISSRFGTRVHPVFKTKVTHTGIDITAPKGTPVGAANSGEVLYAGWLSGYGHVVILDHGGNLITVYAHLSKIECVEGAKVNKRAIIGRVGSTGITTGNHLHFEVRVNGNAVDPMKYLR